MLDILFSLVLLLNLTGLFSFIAPQFNVDIATISLAILALNCLYITVNYKVVLHIIRKKLIFYWSIFLLVGPLLATTYASAINFRELGLQVYYFTLLLAVAVYLLRNGFNSFHRIITIAVAITVAGLILSMFKSEYFQSVSLISGSRIAYQGRAFGFFMQPNRASMNTIFLFIAWFGGLRKHKTITVLFSILGLLIFVSITGSRGGFVMAVAVVLLLVINKSIRVKKPLTILIRPKFIMTSLLTLGCFLASIPLVLCFLTANLPRHVEKFDVVARINAMSEMNLTKKTIEGESTIEQRLKVIKEYCGMIKKRPILGYGWGSISFFKEVGMLSRSSHNQYLRITLEAGVLYLAFYLFLLITIYTHPRRKQVEQLLCTNCYAQFIVVVILAGMVSNTVLDSRVLYCVLGCFLAMLIDPNTVTANSAVKENIQLPVRINTK